MVRWNIRLSILRYVAVILYFIKRITFTFVIVFLVPFLDDLCVYSVYTPYFSPQLPVMITWKRMRRELKRGKDLGTTAKHCANDAQSPSLRKQYADSHSNVEQL